LKRFDQNIKKVQIFDGAVYHKALEIEKVEA
jgi:hypothetical protein